MLVGEDKMKEGNSATYLLVHSYISVWLSLREETFYNKDWKSLAYFL